MSEPLDGCARRPAWLIWMPVVAVFLGVGAVLNYASDDDRDSGDTIGLVVQLLGVALIVAGIVLELRRRRRPWP